MRTRSRRCFIIGLAALLASLSSRPLPVNAQLAVEVYPDTLFVAPGQPDHAFLTVRNDGDSPVELVSLEWLLDGGLEATLGDSLPSTLQPGEAVSRRMSVEGLVRSRGDPVTLSLSFRMGATMRIAVANVPVVEWSPPDPRSVVAVEVAGSLASLHDGDEGSMYLLVRNNTARPVHVDSITTKGPQFIEFQTTEAASIAPGSSRLIGIQLEAKEWVQSGTHTVFFVLHLAWEGPGGRTQGNVVVSRDIVVGVRGESEILTLFSVPTFLLLPGFLMLVAFGMAYQWSGRDPGLAVNPKDLRFWVIAVGLSLLWVYLYPLLPRGRNYLRGYGMVDVAWVWLWSIVLGAVTAWAVHGVRLFRAASQARKDAARTPHPDDDEVATLQKLARRAQGIALRQVEFKLGASTLKGLVLHEANGSNWVAPSILYRWQENAPEEARNGLQSSLESGDPGELADRLERFTKEGWIELYWQRRDGFDHPRLIEGPMVERGHGYLVVEDVEG